ncbi:hypothetical protein FRC05_010235 [Tulasnella sp. 425]|nr:hypothetical protein FRC05_010235 [Tulasnella sp. 425]
MSPFQPKAFDLPVEVIDMIVNWLHRRSDILSLALSHSRFYQVIVPYHLHYRQVEFCIFDYAMWNHLLEDSRRLTKLEVLSLSTHHRPPVPPIKTLSNEPEVPDNAAKVDSDLIHNAFKGVRMLHTVIWDSTGSNLSFGTTEFRQGGYFRALQLLELLHRSSGRSDILTAKPWRDFFIYFPGKLLEEHAASNRALLLPFIVPTVTTPYPPRIKLGRIKYPSNSFHEVSTSGIFYRQRLYQDCQHGHRARIPRRTPAPSNFHLEYASQRIHHGSLEHQ